MLIDTELYIILHYNACANSPVLKSETTDANLLKKKMRIYIRWKGLNGLYKGRGFMRGGGHIAPEVRIQGRMDYIRKIYDLPYSPP